MKKYKRSRRNLENGNPRSAAHVQEEEESIGGAAAELFARVFLEEEGGAEHTLEQAPQGGPRVFLEEGPHSSRPQAHIRAGPSPHSSRPRRGDPEYFWRRRAALRLLPWTRAGFKTVFSDFGRGGGQFLFEVTSTRAADFGGRRRPVRP